MFTGQPSGFNDVLSFVVSYPFGQVADGSVTVNALHEDFDARPFPGGNFTTLDLTLDYTVLTGTADSWIEVSGTAINIADGALGSGVAFQIDCCHPYGTVEIQYKTFIQCEVAGPTPADPWLYDYFRGDDRGFGYGPEFGASKSRTYQQVMMTLDPTAVSAEVGPSIQLLGITQGFDDSPSGSDVTPLAPPTCGGQCSYTFVQGATPECTGTTPDPVGVGLLSIQTLRIDSSTVFVTITNRAQDQCEQFVPGIDVDLVLYLRQVCQNGVLGPVEFKASGTYDGYPWHELYLTGVQVFTHDPCVTGDTPSSMFPWPLGMQYQFEVQQPVLLDWQPVP